MAEKSSPLHSHGGVGAPFYVPMLLAGLLAGGCATQTAGGPGPVPAAGPAAEIAPYGEDLRASPDGMTADALYTLLVAELAGQRGDIDLALDNYLRMMRAVPDVDLAERTARVAVYAQKHDVALEAAQRWVQLAPRSLDARQTLAGELLHANRRDDALKELDFILKSAEGEPAQRMWAVANLLSREEDRGAALDVMDRLIAQHGRTPEALLASAMLALRAEKVDRAREAMDQALDLTPTNDNVALAFIGVLQKQGDTKIATEWLASALKRHPDQHNLRLVYARMLADDKQYDQAYEQFKLIEKAQPKNADATYALGLLELQRQNPRRARPYFEALSKGGDHADEARFYLGQIAEADKKLTEARQLYEQVGDGELRLEARLRVALMMANQGKVAEAQKYLQAIEPRTPADQIRLVRAQGEILTEAGQLQAAMDVYDQALKDGYDPELLYSRAMLAEKMNKLDVLERDLRQILENDPDNSQALNALGYTLADRTTRYDEAYALIKRALELAPNDFYVLDSMGWVLFKQGKFDEAITHLKKARALRDDPEVTAHLVEVLMAKGDRQQAASVLAESMKANQGDERLKKVRQKYGL
jgi:tetratricopeptide (TPR) repeat protein